MRPEAIAGTTKGYVERLAGDGAMVEVEALERAATCYKEIAVLPNIVACRSG